MLKTHHRITHAEDSTRRNEIDDTFVYKFANSAFWQLRSQSCDTATSDICFPSNKYDSMNILAVLK